MNDAEKKLKIYEISTAILTEFRDKDVPYDVGLDSLIFALCRAIVAAKMNHGEIEKIMYSIRINTHSLMEEYKKLFVD